MFRAHLRVCSLYLLRVYDVQQAFWKAIQDGRPKAAVDVRDKQISGPAEDMAKAAGNLRSQARDLLAAAVERGHSEAARSRWILTGAVALFLAVWGVALVVVRRASA